MKWYKYKFWVFALGFRDNSRIKEANGAVWKHLFFGIFLRIIAHEHERDLYVVGSLAFVKCEICGAESIPWEVNSKAAQEFRERHPDNMKKLIAIEKRRRVERG